MQEIRDLFQKELGELLLLAKGLIAVTKFGKFYLEQCDLNTEFCVLVRNESSPLPSVNSEFVKFEDILKIYNQHQSAIEEMINTEFVQKWHDFHFKVFEQILNDHFSGIKSYPKLDSVNILKDFDSSTATARDISKYVESFNFKPADQKLKLIRKLLEVEISAPLTNAIKKHIVVRNVFQHNNGILRDDDIKDLGGKITLLNDHAIPDEFKVGDQLIITYWELEAVRNNFHTVAGLLIC